jgi:hypothetical protein
VWRERARARERERERERLSEDAYVVRDITPTHERTNAYAHTHTHIHMCVSVCECVSFPLSLLRTTHQPARLSDTCSDEDKGKGEETR